MRFCDSLNVRWLPHPTLACVLATLLIHGCGKKEAAPQGPQATVTGSVMFDGKPIKLDSSVVFFCQDKDATAAGMTDALGKFSLKAARTSTGIPVGRYAVMVRPPEPPMPASAAAGPSSPDYQKAMMQSGDAKPPTSTDIPVAFLSLDTSKLVLELKAGPNNFDIDLAKVDK